ncbi:histidine kinase dimerization/phosphoacceptor domain -containing protein [Dyadobacter subterraneus]|uniref:histidine kinase n=1 Tax=Dyadobacter subterraneus TaxID=2773304 RepID=A0ABR9WCQ6_9BACT|nr:sensor histidine kinase [Dyadobacter subterraneus]MBE9463272.1 sensor histidine kinase [Dyadobacter subterraneus]
MKHYFQKVLWVIYIISISMIVRTHTFSQSHYKYRADSLSQLRSSAIHSFKKGEIQRGKNLFKKLIDNTCGPGNEQSEAALWQELAMLIRSRDTTGITRMYCFEKMVSLYKKAGIEDKEIESLKSIADLNMVHGKLDIAEAQLLNVLHRYKAIGYPKIYYVYDLLAVTNRYKGDFSKGILYGLKAVESMEASRDFSPATTIYSRIANMYRELGQTEKSVAWYWKVFRERKYTETVNQYMFRDAGFLARELIKLKKQKEALLFILDIQAKNKPNGVYAKASLLASLAYCYHALGQNQHAERYYRNLITLDSQLEKNNEVTTDVHYEIGQYFINKRQYGKAVIYLHKALNASEGVNSLSDNKEIYMMLYKSDSAMGNYRSAMQYLMKHKILSDSIFNETKSRQIEELHVRYEMAKRKKDMQLLNNQNQQAHKIKNITLGGAVLLLIVIVLLFNQYMIKQKSNRELETHQKELDQKNIFLEKLNAAQDKLLKEKEWLIGEVHHRVKNNLQMVISLLHSQSTYLKDVAAVAAVKDSLFRMQAMSLIHQKLYEHKNTNTIEMPEYINDLVADLRESADTISQIDFEPTIEPLNLDVSQALPLGLIINESIVNIIKYAFPQPSSGVVQISLLRDGPDHILLKISDNGIGLPPGFDITEHHSLGFNLIRGLAKQLKGSFSIESDQGVHITVRFVDLNK